MADLTSNTSVNKLSVNCGLLMGVIVVVLNVVLYIINPIMPYSSIWAGLIVLVVTLAIIIILLVLFGLDIRKRIGGYWPFGQAFKSLFIMGVIITLFSTAYSFILIKYIDPDLPTKANDAMLQNLTTQLTNQGLDQSKIDDYTKSFTNGEFIAKMQPTVKNELIGLVGGVVLYCVFALIIAACIKKKAPFVFPSEEEQTT